MRILRGKKQIKIASFLAMTTIFIAHGRNRGRQHKNNCHCEEERRGNLPHFYTPSTACTPILLVLPVLLWLGMGCRSQGGSEEQDVPLDTVDKSAQATRPLANEFNRTLSHTVLNFRLDDCRSTLHSINRAIDNLNAKTQQDYWESIKQRYAEHKTLYAQLRQAWSEASGQGSAERVNIQAKLAELRLMFQETGTRIERSDKVYAQSREQYEAQKKKDFDELRADQASRNSAEARFHADAQGSMGITALDLTAKHVLVTLAAYSNKLLPDYLVGL